MQTVFGCGCWETGQVLDYEMCHAPEDLEALCGATPPPMISDGDCKSLAPLNEHQPYGEDVKRVGHIQKRVTPELKLARTSFKSDRAAGLKKVKILKEKMQEVREEYGLGSARGRGRGRSKAAQVDLFYTVSATC